MLIAQISDLHFLQKGILSFGKVDTHAHLERCIEVIKAFEPAPDVILITGDLTNDGDLLAYQALVDLLATLDVPLYPIAGNHDDRDLMRAVFPTINMLSPKGALRYVIEDWPLRIIALDSSVDGKPHGLLGEEQLDWLSRALDADRNKPTLVMLHHPPFKTGIGHMDWSMLQDGEALGAVISDHPQVERVLSGHVHRAIQTRFAGTIAQIAPSIAHQVKLTLREGRGPWTMEPPGFLLHQWSTEGGLTTHELPIGSFAPGGDFGDPHTGEPVENEQ